MECFGEAERVLGAPVAGAGAHFLHRGLAVYHIVMREEIFS